MSEQPYTMRTAVLFIAFRRVEESTAVFQAIREARPPRLYFAVDAPRPGKPEEAAQVARIRELAGLVDWPCELKTLFNEVNKGVKYGPWNAMKWFFDQEEEGSSWRTTACRTPHGSASRRTCWNTTGTTNGSGRSSGTT